MNYSAELYDVDASISLKRAEAYARVIRSLNGSQRAYLDGLASGGMLFGQDPAQAAGVTEVVFKTDAVEAFCEVVARLVRPAG